MPLGNVSDPDGAVNGAVRHAGDTHLMRFAHAIHRYMRLLHQAGALDDDTG